MSGVSEQALSSRFIFTFAVLEAAVIFLYYVYVSYASTADFEGLCVDEGLSRELLQSAYPSYQDINVMIFVGFGFLMTYLRSHSWSSVSFNFLAAVVTIQVYILFQGFWQGVFNGNWAIELSLTSLITAEFCVAAVLITYGGVIGKVNYLQFLVISVIEAFFYALNEIITEEKLLVLDVGGSITIHTFGAYFGLAVAWITTPEGTKGHHLNSSSYESNLFAMVGTLFLWMYWPSFNSVTAISANGTHRVILCTVLALTGSCLSSFITSSHFRKGKFHMEDVLNASLAGGVMIGVNSNLITTPFVALLVGFFAGGFSTVGFEVISAKLQEKFSLYDTAGINNLHGMPGVIGGLLSAVFVSSLTTAQIGVISDDFSRSPGSQAGLQFAATLFTLCLAVGSGLATGLLVKTGFFAPPTELFSDKPYWTMEKEAEQHNS
jgi:ammonium transporter Rh